MPHESFLSFFYKGPELLPTLKAEISDVPSMGESSQPVGVFSQFSKVRPVFNPSRFSCFIKGSLLLSVRPFDSIIYPRGFIPFTDNF